MSSFDQVGHAMQPVQDGNRAIAHAIAQAFRRTFARSPASPSGVADDLLSTPTFYQQEPDLTKETRLPGTYA